MDVRVKWFFQAETVNKNRHTLIEKDHLGNWSPEKDCCWRLTFRQPACACGSHLQSLDSEKGCFRAGC